MKKVFRSLVAGFTALVMVVCVPVTSLAAPIKEDTVESAFTILCAKSTGIYAKADCMSSVLNVLLKGQAIKAECVEGNSDFYAIKYGSSVAFVQSTDFVTGVEMEKYVKANYRTYECLVCVENDTSLSDAGGAAVDTAVVGENYVLVDDSYEDRYLVTFDGKEAFIPKESAKLKINVKLTCFAVAASKDGTGESVVQFAEQFLGNPYVWGGTSLVNGTDCSGFVLSVFKQFGVKLPRCSYQQATCGISISTDELQPGDLVFYNRDGRIGHVAIYVGDGKIIHAKGSKYGIVTDDVFYRTPVCARRIL